MIWLEFSWIVLVSVHRDFIILCLRLLLICIRKLFSLQMCISFFFNLFLFWFLFYAGKFYFLSPTIAYSFVPSWLLQKSAMQFTVNNQLSTLGIQARFYLRKRTLKDILAISFPLHLFVSPPFGLLRIGMIFGGK